MTTAPNTFRASILVAVLAFAVLLFALFGVGTLFAQGVPQTEVCNGKDDNGDGVADENVNCDHYLTYLLDKSIQPTNVVLRDQFIPPTNFTLTLIERLMNPVRKLHQGLTFNPKRTDLHYLAYRVQTSAPFNPQTVIIENQFERRAVTAVKPRYLLTPTGKKKIGIPIETLLPKLPPNAADRLIAAVVPPIPQNANHYLCYDVAPYDIAKGVTLRDQFQNRQFEVIRGLYLCNPAEKQHDNEEFKPVDRENHLMCYEVLPHNQVNRKVITHDQFGFKSQNPVRTEELCLPTKKTRIGGCSRPDQDGTAVVVDNTTHYQNTGGQLNVIQSLTPTGVAVTADAILRTSSTTRSGSPAGGETYLFDTEMLSLSLSSGRTLNLPTSGEIHTMPRTPGTPVQSFDTDMFRLQGQLLPGDPDFDLLRIVAGTGNGLPSPGHTTLTQLPGGDWNVDSFFDITYRIDFVGAPGGPYAGMSGSTTGTIRMASVCPPPQEEGRTG